MSDDTVKYDGLVAKIIDERRVVLNKGSRDHISNGDRFIVFNLGGEIHDPETGESLGILEEIKGKGEVIHVQDHMCTIQTYESDIVPVPQLTTGASISMPPIFQGERKERVYRTFVDVGRGDYARKIRGK